MRTWTLLASFATLLYLAGFSLLAAPNPPSKSRTDPDGRAAQRYRQADQTSWRAYFLH